MIKEIQKDGNSHKIRLNAENMKLYKLKQGEVIDIEISKIKQAQDKEI